MLDELAIYNLAVKYPDTIELVREVYNMAIDDFADHITKMANSSSTKYIRIKEYETLGCYGIKEIAEQLKE